jgi:hypothetical protein
MGHLHGGGKHGVFSHVTVDQTERTTTLSLTQFHSLIGSLMFPILLNHKLNQVPQRDDLADQQKHAQQVPPEAPPPLPLPRRRLEPLIDLPHVLPVVCQLSCDGVQLRVLYLDTLRVLDGGGGREGG